MQFDQPTTLLNAKAYPTLALADDIYYFTNWSSATGLYERLGNEQPLLAINSAVVTRLSHKAVALAAAADLNTSLFWSYEDMLQPDVFRTILCDAQQHLVPFELAQLELVLLTIARVWVGLGDEELAKLKAMAPEIPKPQRIHMRPQHLRNQVRHKRRGTLAVAKRAEDALRKKNSKA